MDKVNLLTFEGQPKGFRLDDDAYDRLRQYLDRAGARLGDATARAEVVGDLERSVGDKLAARLGSEDRVVNLADIEAVLARIGAVDPWNGHAPEDEGPRPKRRLQRIKEGQDIAGVCTGIAEYAQVDVDWVRTVFILGTLVTAGILGVVYIALVLILPVAPTRRAA